MFVDIPGYEGLYRINEDGDVLSLIKSRLLKPNKVPAQGLSGKNYLCVRLCKGKYNQKDFYIHRLVALTFLPNPDNKSEVNHKDGNPENNHVNNLEWVTRQENLNHRDNQKHNYSFSVYYEALQTACGIIGGLMNENPETVKTNLLKDAINQKTGGINE